MQINTAGQKEGRKKQESSGTECEAIFEKRSSLVRTPCGSAQNRVGLPEKKNGATTLGKAQLQPTKWPREDTEKIGSLSVTEEISSSSCWPDLLKRLAS